MREIKFRAWDKEDKKMFYVPVWFFSLNVVGLGMGKEKRDLGINHCELMQYTGLKEKNNKEIYESDLVRILYTDWGSKHLGTEEQKKMSLEEYLISISIIGEVVWGYDGWELKFKKNKYEEHTFGRLRPGKHGRMEVIGNIYENPELITK